MAKETPQQKEETKKAFVITIKGECPAGAESLPESALKEIIHGNYSVNGTLLPYVRNCTVEFKELTRAEEAAFYRGSSLVLL